MTTEKVPCPGCGRKTTRKALDGGYCSGCRKRLAIENDLAERLYCEASSTLNPRNGRVQLTMDWPTATWLHALLVWWQAECEVQEAKAAPKEDEGATHFRIGTTGRVN